MINEMPFGFDDIKLVIPYYFVIEKIVRFK